MSSYIGSVTFDFQLQWIDKAKPTVMGSDTRTRSGNLVMLRGESTSQSYKEAKVRYKFAPRADIETLMGYWRAGGSHSADIEDTGTTVTVMFAAANGVEDPQHAAWGDDVVHANVAGELTDLYNGILNLIIL